MGERDVELMCAYQRGSERVSEPACICMNLCAGHALRLSIVRTQPAVLPALAKGFATEHHHQQRSARSGGCNSTRVLVASGAQAALASQAVVDDILRAPCVARLVSVIMRTLWRARQHHFLPRRCAFAASGPSAAAMACVMQQGKPGGVQHGTGFSRSLCGSGAGGGIVSS